MSSYPLLHKALWPRLGLSLLLLGGLASLLWAASQLQPVRDYRAQRLVQASTQAETTEQARSQLRGALALAPRSAAARSALARLELADGRREAAYLELRNLAELHPSDPRGWTGLAGFFLSAKLLEDAEQVLDRAVLAAPADPMLRIQRGDVRLRRGRLYAAWRDGGMAVDLDPEQVGGWLILIHTTEQMQGRPAAMQTARKALALLPHDPRLLTEMRRLEGPPPAQPARAGQPPGTAQYEQLKKLHARRASKDADERWGGRLAQLRRTLEQHLRVQNWSAAQTQVATARSEFPQTLFGPWLAGIVALAQGDDAQAEQFLLEAQRWAPRSELVLNGLLKAWRRQAGAQVAGEKLAALYTADPGFHAVLSLAVESFLSARQPASAAELLLSARRLDRHSAHPYRQQARYYLHTDQPGAAETALQEGLAVFPQDRELLHLRAQLLAARGPSDAALAAYARLIESHPDAESGQAEYALLLTHDARTHDQARQMAQQLAFNHPTDPGLQDRIGSILLQVDAAESALPWLQAAAAIDPQQAAYHYHLAQCYQRLDRLDAAREQVRKALATGQPFAEEIDALKLIRSLETGPPSGATGHP